MTPCGGADAVAVRGPHREDGPIPAPVGHTMTVEYRMNSELPIHLYKANAELQLQLARLLQESGHRWLEAMQQLSADGVREAASRIQGLQQAADWQALATLPPEVFLRVCQGHMGNAQAVGQAAAKSQAAFADGLRQALAVWQEAVSQAFNASGDPAAFAQDLQQWAQPWSAPAAAPKGKARK